MSAHEIGVQAAQTDQPTEAPGSPAAPHLGPGSTLENVHITLLVNGSEKAEIVKSYTLPGGRYERLANGQSMYVATLEHTPVKLPSGMYFDATPCISIVDDLAGDQDVLMQYAIGDRGASPNLKDHFETEIVITLGDQVFKQSDSRYVSCLDGRTPVRMYQGDTLAISEITRRAMVLNPLTGAGVEVAKLIRGPEPYPMHRIGIGGEPVLFTAGHGIPTSDGVKLASEIRPGDLIMDERGRFRPVTLLEVLPVDPDQVVYNLELAVTSERWQDHVILAGNMVVGDYWLQEQLRIGALPQEARVPLALAV